MLDLDSHRWRQRLLLIFAPDADDARYQQQQGLLAGRDAALAERDMLVLRYLESSGPEARAAREQFGLAPGAFALLLVGKDGTVKLTAREPVSPDQVFRLVDSMPMRQQEMGRKER